MTFLWYLLNSQVFLSSIHSGWSELGLLSALGKLLCIILNISVIFHYLLGILCPVLWYTYNKNIHIISLPNSVFCLFRMGMLCSTWVRGPPCTLVQKVPPGRQPTLLVSHFRICIACCPISKNGWILFFHIICPIF